MSYRKASTAFTLTDREKELLEAARWGFSYPEIAQLFGLSTNGFGGAIAIAAEKERLILLAQQDKTRPSRTTLLSTARGTRRMIGDVSKGRWKTG